MSVLLDKSIQNLEAAQKLIDIKLDASSVHCSYYSCVQRMYNIIFEYFGEEKHYILQKCQQQATSSHQLVVNEVKNELLNMSIDYQTKQQFNESLFTLKRNREDADYKQVQIDKTKSVASLGFAKKINTILDKYFKKSEA